jgi:hypothetical protein
MSTKSAIEAALALGTGAVRSAANVLAAESFLTIAATYIGLGVTFAPAGTIRLPAVPTLRAASSATPGSGVVLAELDGSDNFYLGGNSSSAVRPPNIIADATSNVILRINGNNGFTVSNGGASFGNGIPTGGGAFGISHIGRTTDATVSDFLLTAQNAWTGAGNATNINGGALRLRSGSAKTDGTAGVRGAVRMEIGGAGVVMIEGAEPGVGRRVVALCRGAALTATQMPANTGDLVAYLANCAAAPTANAFGGGILYSDAGALKWRGPSGTITTIAAA